MEITKEEYDEAIKEAYFEGYREGNSDGSRYTGCRGCYDHDPIDDAESSWNDSQTKDSMENYESYN